MARVTRPLFSVSASGNMGKGALQFRGDKWGSHVYKPLGPEKQNKGSASVGQIAQRARFLAVTVAWRELDPMNKQEWCDRAVSEGYVSGWNLFLAVGLGKGIYPEDTLFCLDGSPVLNDYGEILRCD